MNLPALRYHNQLLATPLFDDPCETVAWFGAMQAQDYLGALWAVGVRTRGATERSVEEAIARGGLVRTWPMRGTLHLLAAADVRWMLGLLAPYTVARSGRRMRELGIDAPTIARASDAWARALEGGRRLTRDEMRDVLARAGIDTSGQRAYQLLWRCAHEGVICIGPRQGKQHTFVLLDEWVPPAPPLARDEALQRLATRYFQAHGPATLRDLAWWSGLPAAEARKAVELAAEGLQRLHLQGDDYWVGSAADLSRPRLPPRMLPPFDEYLVGYTRRDAVLDPAEAARVNAGGGLLAPTVALKARIRGVWKRTLRRKAVSIEVGFFSAAGPAETRALERAAAEYARFLGLEADLHVSARGAA